MPPPEGPGPRGRGQRRPAGRAARCGWPQDRTQAPAKDRTRSRTDARPNPCFPPAPSMARSPSPAATGTRDERTNRAKRRASPPAGLPDSQAVHAAAHGKGGDGGQHPCGAEGGRGKPDGVVRRGQGQGIEQITQPAGQEGQQPGQPRPQPARNEPDKDPADDGVAEHMRPVPVQGQGREDPPPLAVQDTPGMGAAKLRPQGRIQPPARIGAGVGKEEQEQQHHSRRRGLVSAHRAQVGQADPRGGPARSPPGRGGFRRRRAPRTTDAPAPNARPPRRAAAAAGGGECGARRGPGTTARPWHRQERARHPPGPPGPDRSRTASGPGAKRTAVSHQCAWHHCKANQVRVKPVSALAPRGTADYERKNHQEPPCADHRRPLPH